MEQKKIKREQVRPPAYPQVELLSDVLEYITKCRFCGETTDLEKVIDLNGCKPGKPIKHLHTCGNTFKIVYDAKSNN